MKAFFEKVSNYFNDNLALVGIVIAGLLLRLWHLTAISLWHDEAFSALLIKYSWGEMMHRIGLDVHPPMYYIFLRLWSYIFGSSLYSLRGMSVLFGVATIIVVYHFVKYTFANRSAAIMAALFVALNPFQIQYVTEARMYTMGAFFAMAAALCLVAALRNQLAYYNTGTNIVLAQQLKKKFLLNYALFVVCSVIIMYTHYYLLFTAAALGVYAILFCLFKFKLQITKWIWVVLSGVAMLVLFVPWLKVFLFQLKQVGAGYWIPPMDRWSIPNTIWELGITLPLRDTPLGPHGWFSLGLPATHFAYLITAIVTLVVIYKLLRKYVEPEKWLVLIAFLAPFGGAILFFLMAKLQHSDSSVYLVRYFIFCSAFFSVILALFLSTLKVKQVGYAFALILIAVNLFAVWRFWNDLQVQTKPGMAAAAKFLNTNVEPGQKIYVGSSFEFFNFKYYNHSNARPLLYTDGHHVHDLPHFAGTAILTDEDLVLNFSDSTRHGDTVWMLWTNGFGGSKPNVPKNWIQVDEKGFAEVRPYVGTWVIVTEYKVN